jgi:hypothetical protein
MNYNKKFGICALICSVLGIILTIMLSDGWRPELSAIDNFLVNLHIYFFLGEKTLDSYFISIPTKYVVFLFILLAAYGYLTYLEITPALKKKYAHTHISSKSVKE